MFELEDHYPVYIRIRYNNKQTELKSKVGIFLSEKGEEYYSEPDDDLNEIKLNEEQFNQYLKEGKFESEITFMSNLFFFWLKNGHNLIEEKKLNDTVSTCIRSINSILNKRLQLELMEKMHDYDLKYFFNWEDNNLVSINNVLKEICKTDSGYSNFYQEHAFFLESASNILLKSLEAGRFLDYLTDENSVLSLFTYSESKLVKQIMGDYKKIFIEYFMT